MLYLSFSSDFLNSNYQNNKVRFVQTLLYFYFHCFFNYRNNIEKRWEELTSQNNRIYNKSKFRLENFTFDETLKKVHLEVGLTDYKGKIVFSMAIHFRWINQQPNSNNMYRIVTQTIFYKYLIFFYFNILRKLFLIQCDK